MKATPLKMETNQEFAISMHNFQPSFPSNHHPRKQGKKTQMQTQRELKIILKTQTETQEIDKNLKPKINRPTEDSYQKTATHQRNQSKIPH